MLSNLKKILALLTPHERKRAFQLLGLMCVVALFETFGVASIFPFIAVLSRPEVIHENALLARAYNFLGFTSPERFLFFLGLLFFLFVIGSIALKALYTYAQALFSEKIGFSLSHRLVSGYLSQPYEWFLNQHSADLGKTVLTEVESVINGAVRPMMNLCSKGLIALCLVALLVWMDPLMALIAGIGLGGAYGLIYTALRKKIKTIGAERVKANRQRFTAVQETFGGIKEVKVAGLEGGAAHRYRGPAKRFARARAINQIASQLPPMAMEALIMGGFVLVALFILGGEGELETMMPVLAVYGFAVFRLRPSIQALFTSFMQMRFSGPALDNLHESLSSLTPDPHNPLKKTPPEPLGIQKNIQLHDVHYFYPNCKRPALEHISIDIPARATVGLVGSTGAGKTTLVDILLGLLRPRQGALRVDGQDITPANVRNWQRTLGYVPQHIYLADTTVAANIAFGLDEKDIDLEAVERAAKIANLHHFVTDDMPDGYHTIIGERGVRLSGGQRQRIGIARALYHDPDVLVLDEATSALDNLTEKAVMEAVNNLGHQKTIILIAHRLSTVQNCDTIFVLKHGKLVGQGTYDQLVASNQSFREMVVGGT